MDASLQVACNKVLLMVVRFDLAAISRWPGGCDRWQRGGAVTTHAEWFCFGALLMLLLVWACIVDYSVVFKCSLLIQAAFWVKRHIILTKIMVVNEKTCYFNQNARFLKKNIVFIWKHLLFNKKKTFFVKKK